MPVALLPDSAAPFTAPAVAPTPVNTAFTGSFARLRIPFEDLFRPDFLVALFLLALLRLLVADLRTLFFWLDTFVVLLLIPRGLEARDEADFFAVDFLKPFDLGFLEPDCLRDFFVAIVCFSLETA